MKLPDNSLCVIPIEPTGSDKINWSWDGNIARPTLTPSILHWGLEDGIQFKAWHGHITGGRMESE